MTTAEIESLAKLVRQYYGKDNVTNIIMTLGYEVSGSGHFRIRPDEKSASACVSKLGLINDFGGEGYDILKLLIDHHQMQFVDALKWVADQWRINYTDTQQQHSPAQAQQYTQPPPDPQEKEKMLKKVFETLSWYDSYRDQLQTFTNYEYKNEALAIAPLWLYKGATKEALQNFKNVTTYDHKNRTIVAKIFDYNGVPISYKRRRYQIPGTQEVGKWITKGGTSPNGQCFMDIDPIGVGPVYVIEGHHDMLTAILMKGDKYEPFDFIMVPTENYKEFNEYEMSHLINRDVHFILDLKYLEDGSINQKAYYKLGMHQLAAQVKNQTCRESVGIDLKDFLKTERYQVDHLKSIDLSDAIFIWQNGLSAFKGALQFYVDSRRK